MAGEYYELRTYKIFDYEKQEIADQYLETALLPALMGQGVRHVGVFHNLKDENDHSIYVLIVWPNLNALGLCNEKLGVDAVYQEAAKPHTQRPPKDGIFDRIETRLLKAFSGMSQLEMPTASQEGSDRIFELRLYQSHTEESARRKVDMFNNGESQLMKDVELGPVFFGETIVGADMPNLVYLLCAKNEDEHKKHFQDFLDSPRWKAMKDLPQYKGTVSKIESWFLKPTSYSMI